jgi:catechol 2,3-dioxygenase-like lactoylglutathione lyase family enzyme
MKINSLSIKTTQIEKMKEFYSALGLVFEKVQITRGSIIEKTVVNDIEFNLMPTDVASDSKMPSFQFSFNVQNIELVCLRLKEQELGLEMLELNQFSDRKSAVFLDPDGNAVELYMPTNP